MLGVQRLIHQGRGLLLTVNSAGLTTLPSLTHKAGTAWSAAVHAALVLPLPRKPSPRHGPFSLPFPFCLPCWQRWQRDIEAVVIL